MAHLFRARSERRRGNVAALLSHVKEMESAWNEERNEKERVCNERERAWTQFFLEWNDKLYSREELYKEVDTENTQLLKENQRLKNQLRVYQGAEVVDLTGEEVILNHQTSWSKRTDSLKNVLVIEQHVEEVRQTIEDTDELEQNFEVMEKFQDIEQNIERDMDQPEDIENVEQNVEVIDLTFDEDDDITTPASSSFSYTASSTTSCTPFSSPSPSLCSTFFQNPSSHTSKRSRDEYSSDSEDLEDERPAKRAALDQEMTRHRFQHD